MCHEASLPFLLSAPRKGPEARRTSENAGPTVEPLHGRAAAASTHAGIPSPKRPSGSRGSAGEFARTTVSSVLKECLERVGLRDGPEVPQEKADGTGPAWRLSGRFSVSDCDCGPAESERIRSPEFRGVVNLTRRSKAWSRTAHTAIFPETGCGRLMLAAQEACLRIFRGSTNHIHALIIEIYGEQEEFCN